MTKNKKMMVATWVAALAAPLLVALCYGSLPAQVPTHWNLDGSVTYSVKAELWLIAGLSPLLALILTMLPRIDPKRRSYDKFRGSYNAFCLTLMLFLLCVLGFVLLESVRPGTLDIGVVICIICSLLFMFLGNMMPKFRQNYFCGFRTPWTISSETVWTRTHRFGGRLFFVAGVVGLASCLIVNQAMRFTIFMVAVGIAAVLPCVLSYFWYTAEQKTNQS